MLYPIFVHHREAGQAVGFEFPDFPGCFGAADDWQNVARMAQEALECHFAGESLSLPRATDPSQVSDHEAYADGVWMMVDIDVTKLDDTPSRVNVSLPKNVLARIDEHTKKTHETRSGFLAKAAMKELDSMEAA